MLALYNIVTIIGAMAKPTANLRLFVGVYPPAELAAAMVGLLPPLKLPPHRLTPVEQLHLTLQFIGDVPARELDDTIESVERAAAGLSAFALTPQSLIALPERGPKRLIAMETDAPSGLLEVQRRLAARLATNARPRPGDRFRPHLTLCRFRSPARGLSLDATPALPPFAVEGILLMRSTLGHEGAQHHELKTVALGN